MRWLWIDKFLEFRTRESAKAVKNVSSAEDYLRDHYPGYPCVPGALIIEGMAQTGGVLAGEAGRFEKMVVLAKLSRVQFHDQALPGDQLTYEANLLELREEGSAVNAKAWVNGRLLAEAEIFFAHIDRTRVGEVGLKSFADYREQMMHILGVPPSQSPDG